MRIAVMLGWALQLMSTVLPLREGEVYQRFSADLDGDGQFEQVDLQAYGVETKGYWGQLQVVGSQGRLLWLGPKARQPAGWEYLPIFGSFSFGESRIQAVGDIDGDGRCELISALPGIASRPARLRVFRWDGTAFTLVRMGWLLQSLQAPDSYLWQGQAELAGPQGLSWIATVEQADGRLEADVYRREGVDGLSKGRAQLTPLAQGYRIHWLETPQPVASPQAASTTR